MDKEICCGYRIRGVGKAVWRRNGRVMERMLLCEAEVRTGEPLAPV